MMKTTKQNQAWVKYNAARRALMNVSPNASPKKAFELRQAFIQAQDELNRVSKGK